MFIDSSSFKVKKYLFKSPKEFCNKRLISNLNVTLPKNMLRPSPMFLSIEKEDKDVPVSGRGGP
jgi:hypothetical protein